MKHFSLSLLVFEIFDWITSDGPPCIEECREIKDWFSILGGNKEEVWDRIWSEDLDERKGEGS